MDEMNPETQSDEQEVTSTLVAISEMIELKKLVTAGKFCSYDEALAHNAPNMCFTQLGDDYISALALSRIERSLRDVDSGNFITDEEVNAKFDKLFRDSKSRTDGDQS